MKRTDLICGAISGRALAITYDVTPAPGAIVADLGHGVTVAEREAPATPGAVWAAPYAANCAYHGWIVSRAQLEHAAQDGRAHIATMHAAGMGCPFCGSADVPGPEFNGYTHATRCHTCGARMTAEAATAGTDAHVFIWNNRNQDFRAAGYRGITVDTGRGCCGGMEDLPAGTVAWQSADGWLWCRMHLDALLRQTVSV